jgi:catechol 2,3-dioxygenase-like lactoylglutathione lyase family enzyme
MIKGLAHVCLGVADLGAAIGFYRKLGLSEAFEFINDKGVRYGVYLHVGGRNFIELFTRDPKSPAASGEPSFRHICIEVDDVAATVAQLRSAGIQATDPKLGSDKSWQAWITDPDGNRIELHGYTPASRQTPHLR